MKISVLLSVHLVSTENKLQLIRAIQSFLAQSYSDKELIVVAYHCPLTKRVVETFTFAFPEIKCVFIRRPSPHFEDIGSTIAATNSVGYDLAREHATGDLLCFLAHHDILSPSHLKNIAKVWTRNPAFKWAINRCRIMHPMVFKLESGFKDPYVRPPTLDAIKTKDLERYGIVEPLFVEIESPANQWILDRSTLVVTRDIVGFKFADSTETMKLLRENTQNAGQFYSATYIVGRYKNLWNL